jgi:gamma-glutamyltranspeptidase / glutathione hydrolase
MTDTGGRVGPKRPATGTRAVCSSQHPIVTETMLGVMRDGGNAVDAAIAGCLVQAVVQQDMTNHTGSVSFLLFEAATGKTYELNSTGGVIADLAPFRRVPPPRGLYAPAGSRGPFAVVPGFMPGLKGLYERFGTRPWASLCEEAVRWAEEGHVVDSFEHLVMAQTVEFFLYTPSGRAHFTPDGHLPQVGDRWPKPELAATMRALADEGPDHFIAGGWARAFVERGNDLGWDVTLEHMSAFEPRWGEGTRYVHRGHEIVQLSPPERQAVYCSIVLGILDELGVADLGPPSASAESLYYLAHALRRAHLECGFVNDPRTFEDPSDVLMSREYHRAIADVLRSSRPRTDLTSHVKLEAGPAALTAAGAAREVTKQPAGSCELSLVDADGNWVQMMNTLQSGGIPGEVVGGVPMVGSHAITNLNAQIANWFTDDTRIRCVFGHTFVMSDGRPWLSLGSPGNVHCTVPQVLSNVLDHGMDPYAAEDAPRILPLTDDYKVGVESRAGADVVDGLARLGVLVDPLPAYDYHMGSYQMCWRTDDGVLHSSAGPRRSGNSAGF